MNDKKTHVERLKILGGKLIETGGTCSKKQNKLKTDCEKVGLMFQQNVTDKLKIFTELNTHIVSISKTKTPEEKKEFIEFIINNFYKLTKTESGSESKINFSPEEVQKQINNTNSEEIFNKLTEVSNNADKMNAIFILITAISTYNLDDLMIYNILVLFEKILYDNDNNTNNIEFLETQYGGVTAKGVGKIAINVTIGFITSPFRFVAGVVLLVILGFNRLGKSMSNDWADRRKADDQAKNIVSAAETVIFKGWDVFKLFK